MCVCLYEGTCVCALVFMRVKNAMFSMHSVIVQKVFNLINIFIEISGDIYMNTHKCAVVSGAMPAGEIERKEVYKSIKRK